MVVQNQAQVEAQMQESIELMRRELEQSNINLQGSFAAEIQQALGQYQNNHLQSPTISGQPMPGPSRYPRYPSSSIPSPYSLPFPPSPPIQATPYMTAQMPQPTIVPPFTFVNTNHHPAHHTNQPQQVYHQYPQTEHHFYPEYPNGQNPLPNHHYTPDSYYTPMSLNPNTISTSQNIPHTAYISQPFPPPHPIQPILPSPTYTHPTYTNPLFTYPPNNNQPHYPYNVNPHYQEPLYTPPYYPEHQYFLAPFDERDRMRTTIEQKLGLCFDPIDWCMHFNEIRKMLLERYPEVMDDLSSSSPLLPSTTPLVFDEMPEKNMETVWYQTPSPTMLQTPPLAPTSLISQPFTIEPNSNMPDDSKDDELILPSPMVMENQEPKKDMLQGQEETKHDIAESPSLAEDVCSPDPSIFCASKILCEPPSIPPIVLFAPLPKLPLSIQHATTTTTRTEKNIQNVVGHQDPSRAHKMFDLFSNPTICQQNKLIQAYSSHVCYHYCFFVKFLPTRPPLKPPDTSQVLGTPFNQPTPYLQQATSLKLSRFDQTLRNFSKMLSHGILPDSFVVPRVVKACGRLLALKIGKQVHGVAFVSGFASDLLLLSSLVHMYIKFDDIRHAHKLFNMICQPDVVIWSALVSSYARHGYVVEANELFNKMRDSRVGPNLISWNGMIAGSNNSGLYSQAVAMFQQMHLQGIQPDGVTIFCVLPAAGDLEDLNMGIQVHGYVIKQGLGLDKCVISALIDMYGKRACSFDMSRIFDEIIHFDVENCNAFIAGLSRNGLAEDALRVFGQVRGQGVQMSVISWTSTMACCSQNGKDIEALELFREMQIAGVELNSVTIPCLLPACGNIAALMYGKTAHCFSLRRGIFNNVYVCSAIIDMYANCGKIQVSRLCFDGLTGKNLVGWNTMMGGYAMHGKAKEAINLSCTILAFFLSFAHDYYAIAQAAIVSKSKSEKISESTLMKLAHCLYRKVHHSYDVQSIGTQQLGVLSDGKPGAVMAQVHSNVENVDKVLSMMGLMRYRDIWFLTFGDIVLFHCYIILKILGSTEATIDPPDPISYRDILKVYVNLGFTTKVEFFTFETSVHQPEIKAVNTWVAAVCKYSMEFAFANDTWLMFLQMCKSQGVQKQVARIIVYFNVFLRRRVDFLEALMHLTRSLSWSWWLILKASLFKGFQDRICKLGKNWRVFLKFKLEDKLDFKRAGMMRPGQCYVPLQISKKYVCGQTPITWQ